MRSARTRTRSNPHTGDYWCGGIDPGDLSRRTSADARGRLTIVTDLTHDDKDATLKAEIKVAGKPGQHFEVAGQLYQLDGTRAGTPEMRQAGTLNDAGNAVAHLSQSVDSPKSWSAEKPDLYYFVTALAVDKNLGGANAGAVRQASSKLKSKPAFFIGMACRSNAPAPAVTRNGPVSGHALTEQEWQTDGASHEGGQHQRHQNEPLHTRPTLPRIVLEKGFYILDEIPFCWALSPKKISYLPAEHPWMD